VLGDKGRVREGKGRREREELQGDECSRRKRNFPMYIQQTVMLS
jgi:hypothetical protein